MKMLRPYLQVVIFLFSSTTLFGQDWLWVKNLSCTNTSQVMGMKIDRTGNIVQTLSFLDNINISGRAISSKGNSDIILAKYKPDGDTLWVKKAGSTGLEIPRDLFITSNNEIILTGGFSGVCSFDNKQITNTFSSEDIFLTKYAADGTVLWAKNIAWGPGQTRSSGIVVDGDGNIEMVGFFANSIYFESDTLVSNGVINNFFAKFDKDGNFIKAVHFPGTNAGSRLNEISLGTDNSLLISGFYLNSITIYNESFVSKGSGDLMLIKLDTDGNKLWTRTAGGNTDDRAVSATSDIYGNIYFTGYVSNNPTFDSTGADLRNSSILKTKGGIDIFAAKYNKNGTLQWKTANGNTGIDQGMGISVYNNIIQFTGSFSGTVIFKEDTLKSSSVTDEDPGIFMYNTDGDPIRGISVKGSGIAIDQGRSAIYDNQGNIYFNGTFFSDVLSFKNLSITKTAIGIKNSFLAKYQLPFSAAFTDYKNITCNGVNSGELIATPYFGAPPFTYTWSANVTSFNDSLAYNLPAGTYTVTVTDSKGTIATASYTITQPTPINIASAQTDVNCNPADGTANNGAVNITVTGGTKNSGYDYFWTTISGSGAVPTAEDQTALAKGSYQVTVRDDNLCEASKIFTINEPPLIVFAGSSVTDASGGSNNGAISLNVTGGNNPPAYTNFTWSNGAITQNISSIIGGNYTVIVKDSKGCQQDTAFMVNDLSLLQVSIVNVTNVDCKGNSTGSITVSVANGSGNYNYDWRNSANLPVGFNLPTLSDYPAGTYFINITDNISSDVASASAIITEPSQALSSSISGIDATCYGKNTGIVNLNVIGGTLPYRFNWTNGSTTEDLVNVSAGNYLVTVTDTNNCFTNNNVDITEPTPLDINVSVDQEILCFGDQIGRVTATASGGTGQKSYLWNDPGNQTDKTATSLFGGTYHVIATDLNGCTIEDNVILYEPDSISIIPAVTEPSCFGSSTGSISLTVTGGSPSFDYVWSNGQFSKNISNLTAGVYNVALTDNNLCASEAAITVTQPTAIAFTDVQFIDPSCFGLNDGQIEMHGQGGAGNFQYSINGGGNFLADSVFTGILAGNFNLVLRDGNNCLSADSSISISQPAEILFQLVDLNPSTCFGTNDASLEIKSIGGAGAPYRYSIDNGANYSVDTIFSDLTAQSYHLRILDAANCESADSLITISEPAAITISSEIADNVSCHGLANGGITILVSGNAADYKYSIDNGASYTSNNGVFNSLPPGDYQVHVRNTNNCDQTGSAITVTEPDSVIIDTTSVTQIINNINGSITAKAEGGSSSFTYILQQTGSDSISNANGIFTDLQAGNYVAYAVDNNSCKSDTLQITILQTSTKLEIFDAFSPNNDGVNEVWNITNIWRYPNCVVTVFNSWGNQVFSSNGYSIPWDGMHNGKYLPAGTYYYVIDLGDGSDVKAGPVSIVR